MGRMRLERQISGGGHEAVQHYTAVTALAIGDKSLRGCILVRRQSYKIGPASSFGGVDLRHSFHDRKVRTFGKLGS